MAAWGEHEPCLIFCGVFVQSVNGAVSSGPHASKAIRVCVMALVTYRFFVKEVQGFEILEAKVMFFTFSTFTKINIVVNMSAAGRVNVDRNPPHPHPHPLLFFSLSNTTKYFMLFGYISV